MKSTRQHLFHALVALLILVSPASLRAQDRFALVAPNGIAFSEIRGYEDWSVVAPSFRTDNNEVRVILANKVMILSAGCPRGRRQFPGRIDDREDRLLSGEKPELCRCTRSRRPQTSGVHNKGFHTFPGHERLGLRAVSIRPFERDLHALRKGYEFQPGMLCMPHHREGPGLHLHEVSIAIARGVPGRCPGPSRDIDWTLIH